LALKQQQYDLEDRVDEIQTHISRIEKNGAEDMLLLERKLVTELVTTSCAAFMCFVLTSYCFYTLLCVNIQMQQTELKQTIQSKLEQYDGAFHHRWGPLLKAGFQISRFARQASDFACIYTSRASNIGLVSPYRPFRPTKDAMAHDQYIGKYSAPL